MTNAKSSNKGRFIQFRLNDEIYEEIDVFSKRFGISKSELARKSISRFIGNVTNNIAELEAIKAGLLEVKKRELPVRIFTDSSYAYGLLALNWKAHKNRELVNSIRKLMSEFKNLKMVKVKGHSGNQGNELADRLAVSAIENSGRL